MKLAVIVVSNMYLSKGAFIIYLVFAIFGAVMAGALLATWII